MSGDKEPMTPSTENPRLVADLAHAVAEHAVGVETDTIDAAEKLRDLLAAELDRVGTTVGLLDVFELTPALLAARIARVKVDEAHLTNQRDRRTLATVLVVAFAATAVYERRLRKLNAERTGTSVTA